jgi:DNA-binding transcriptional LysR family regulator
MGAMRPTHLRQVDLNLLLALHALLEERHVTRAAKRCFLSQSAMSRALERLREMFGDALLIRTGRAYERTVRGDRLLRELQSLLPRLESMVRGEEFDPGHGQERFRLAVRHHASITLVPPLIRRIRTEAPGVRLEVSEWEERVYDALIAGKLDAALSAEHPPSGLESEVLFQVDFVCVVGAAQKVRPRRFTLAQYLNLPHVAVETWAGQQTPVDRPLAQFGAKRHVVVSVSFFSAAIFAVANTDLVVTVPRRLTKIVRPLEGVRLVEPPREIKAFPYFMVWHPRLNQEPAHAWFREQVRVAARTI